MKIAFNPSTVAALTTPPNNKDITFDLRGHNIFARGVKFLGTDTNTWRDIKVNNVSIGSNILDLRNGSNTTLTNTNGVVTINSTWRPVVDNLTSNSTTSSLSANQGRVLAGLINGKSDSGHTHDDRYLKLTGGTMTGNIILSPNVTIIKPLLSTSNYDSVVRWSIDGETKKYGREIGLHNDGGSDSTGSIAIVPYKTDTEPWLGTVGLFIAKNALLLDGKPIALKSDLPSSLKNPYSLTLLANGTTLATYDGSVSKIVNLTYDNVGAAAKNHTHNSLEPWASYINGDSHAAALKSIFNKNKTSIPRNKFISMLSSAYGNGSYYMGYFLYGYENNPYGGFFVAHYDAAYYIGISNGSFTQHRLVYSTDIPSSLKNPYALTISLNGTSQGPYDGSAAKNINITPSSIGAATSGHNHDDRYLKLTGGTMLLGEGLKFHADENYFGTYADARIISLLDGNDTICDGGLIIDERATLDGKEYVTELLRIRDSEFKWKGSNILHSGNSYINGSTITINGSSLNVIDLKVTLSFVSSGYTDFRAVLITAETSSDSAGYTPSTVTGQTFITNALQLSPQAGNLYLKGSAAIGTTNFNHKLNVNGDIGLLNTGSIRDLAIGGGIYWYPYVESTTDGSDAASITLVRLGVAGGTTLVLSLMNDANDTILFQTNGSARLYHNSYPILTTLNTYVNNNKGYINGTEITLVNNARGAYIATLTLDVATLIRSGYLASDYTNRYDTLEYMKAAAKYLLKNYSNLSVFGTMVPNSLGFFTANIYSDGFNSNGNPEHITIHYYPHGGNIINCGTSYGNWYWDSVSKDGHTHSWQSITDKIVGGNEFNIVNAGYSENLAINYLPINNRNSSANIGTYIMYNGNRGLASVYAKRFKVDGKGCMWKEARDYAPFYSTFNGGFEPILDIKTVSGDWSIGSYDSTGNYLIFAYESDSDYNAGVNGTALYWLSPGGEFKINTLKLAGPTSTNMGIGSTNPQIIFSKSDYSLLVALTYTDADAYRPSKGLKVHSYDGSDDSNVWFEVLGYNYSSGYVKNGSNSSYVLLGDGGHKAESSLNVANANTVDNIHATGFLRWKGMLNIGNNAPFQAVVDIIKDTSKLNDGGLAFYSYAGEEYTVLIGSRNDAKRHGNALKWGYANKYLWMIRMINGSPRSSDWEKISAGYADSAGSVAWDNVTNKPATATRWPSWAEVTGKPSSFTPTSHNHSFTLGATTITTGETRTAINGPFAICTYASAEQAFSICRENASEGVKHWVDDSTYHIEYTNDEAASSIAIRLIDTDIERATNKGADAKDVTVYLDCYRNFYPSSNNTGSIGVNASKWANMYATTFHGSLDGNATTATNTDMIDGIHANGLLTALSNSNNGISITVGGTTKSISNISVNYANSAGNADTLDGYHASSFYTSNHIRSDQNSIYDLRCNYGQYDKGDFHGTYADEYPYPYGMYFSLALGNNNTSALMFFECSTNNVLGHVAVKTRGAGDWNTTYSEWGTLAYLTDNVASATKLQTPRTIWGQSFDGTGNVNGTIYINNSNSRNGAIRLNNDINANARISAISDQVIFNTGNAIRFGETAWDLDQWAGLKYTHSNKTIYLGIADGSAFTSNSALSGGILNLRAGISNIDLNSGTSIRGLATNGSPYVSYINLYDTSISLSAYGDISMSTGPGAIELTSGYGGIELSCLGNKVSIGSDIKIESSRGVYLNSGNSGNVNLCQGGGNVGIGTTSPAYKLDVNGLMRASGFHHANHDSNNYILLAGGGCTFLKNLIFTDKSYNYTDHSKYNLTFHKLSGICNNLVWVDGHVYGSISTQFVVDSNVWAYKYDNSSGLDTTYSMGGNDYISVDAAGVVLIRCNSPHRVGFFYTGKA